MSTAFPPCDDDDLAYDGSDAPPRRDLTARERDVMCRIITLVLHDSQYAGEELDRLREIRYVIDPRRDVTLEDWEGTVSAWASMAHEPYLLDGLTVW